MKKRLNKKGGMALSQIVILIIGIIAVGYGMGVVSAFGHESDNSESIMAASLTGPFDIHFGSSPNPVYNLEMNSDPSRKPSNAGAGASTTFNYPPELSFEGGVSGEIGLPGGETADAIISNNYDQRYALGKDGTIYEWKGPSDTGEWEVAQKGGERSWISETLNLQKGGYLDAIASSAQWALTVYFGVKMAAGFFGLDDDQADAAATAAAIGTFVGKGSYTLFDKGGKLSGWFSENIQGGWLGDISPGTFSAGAGLLVAVIIFYNMYKNERIEVVLYTCEPWDAPTGGERCEDCNKQGILPCSKYQCRSLGQACELLNPGTDEEKCEWVNRHDVNPPVIRPEDNALLDNYRYTPDNTISPPDSGVMIDNQDSTSGCVKAFTPLTFGISTDEPSKCKLDYLRKDNFDEMAFYFGGSNLFRYNHTQMLSLPGPSSLRAENLTLENDGDFTLYTRCSDANGNYNTANFVFKYCVEQGPDTTPPLIVDTNLLNNMPVAYNTSELDLIVYTNEPASCKWSHLDQSYNDMEETMSCSSSITEMNAQLLYECETTLTSIQDREENEFFFRCKDQPLAPENDSMVNQESYEYVVIGTQPLILDFVGPNGTIKDSTNTVKVTLEAETSAGYNEGEATCYFSDVDETNSYIPFFNTDSYVHSQDLWLPEGDYEYFIKCIDLGGNQDSNVTKFKTESDADAPIIVRAYHEESYLKLVTNEKAECVYDSKSCSYLFNDGIKITVIDDVEHFTDWSTNKNFYIKCRDDYGKEPLPNECSMVVRPYQVFSSSED